MRLWTVVFLPLGSALLHLTMLLRGSRTRRNGCSRLFNPFLQFQGIKNNSWLPVSFDSTMRLVTTSPDIQEVEQQVVKLLKNSPLSSLNLSRMNFEYQKLHGKPIDCTALGYKTLSTMLRSFESVKVETIDTTAIVSLVDKKMSSDLVTTNNESKLLAKTTYVDSMDLLHQVMLKKHFKLGEEEGVYSLDVEIADEELSLVQISTVDETFVFDAMRIGTRVVRDALADFLEDPKKLKVIHDLHSEAQYLFNGRRVEGLFDTQLFMEHVVGDSIHVRYDDMLRQLGLPVHPHKREMTIEWNVRKRNPFATRPLSSFALEYAILDTRLLRDAWDAIIARLDETLIQGIKRASARRASRALIDPDWRCVCFHSGNNCRLASYELLLHKYGIDHVLMQDEVVVHDELESLLEVLPRDLAESMSSHPEYNCITEIVLDFGEIAYARKDNQRINLGSENRTVTEIDLNDVMKCLDRVGSDNRAGINGQLHRISVIRNREHKVVGMTMRVGRYVTGSTFLLSDILKSDNNILFLGPPSSRKTTIVREVSRVLSQEKIVFIVDTSGEIAGPGDIKHSSVGHARRMFVKGLNQQRDVMIECIQNHRPEVLVVDEIGRKKEADAARTASTRGVRVIATAHGSLRSLVDNPETNGLVGGVTSVIYGDGLAQSQLENSNEARVKKSRLERAAKPVFDVIVELGVGADADAEHKVIFNPADAVDKILGDREYTFQTRRWQEQAGASPFFFLQFGRG